MTPRSRNASENCLALLNSYYRRFQSWNKVAERLRVHKKTLMRWRKNGSISRAYQRIITDFIRKRYPEKITDLGSHNRRRAREQARIYPVNKNKESLDSNPPTKKRTLKK